MPLNLQGKVLRALETKTIQRLGSTRSKKVDFRLLTASNEDLYHLVEEKKFRADLYYRLAVIPIRLPPLRERREDIIPLAQHFLKLFCRKYAKDKEFSPQTLQLMIQYPWPGNVRELRNFVERAVVMSLGRQVAVPDVSSFLDPASRRGLRLCLFARRLRPVRADDLLRRLPPAVSGSVRPELRGLCPAEVRKFL